MGTVGGGKIMSAPFIPDEIQVVGMFGMKRRHNGRCRNIAYRSVGQSFVAIGIVGAVVVPDSVGCNPDMGISAIVESSIHLKTHVPFQPIENHGGNFRHFIAVGSLFLYDRSYNQNSFPCRGVIAYAGFFSQCFVAFPGKIDKVLYNPAFIVMKGDVVGIRQNASLFIGALPEEFSHECASVFIHGFSQLFQEYYGSFAWDEGYFFEPPGSLSQFVKEFKPVHAVFPQVYPPALGRTQPSEQEGIYASYVATVSLELCYNSFNRAGR